jgi:hypothetical protein
MEDKKKGIDGRYLQSSEPDMSQEYMKGKEEMILKGYKSLTGSLVGELCMPQKICEETVPNNGFQHDKDSNSAAKNQYLEEGLGLEESEED